MLILQWSLLCSAILRSRAGSLRSHVILLDWIAFYSALLNIHRSGELTALTRLLSHETAAVSAHSVYTTQPGTMSLYEKRSVWSIVQSLIPSSSFFKTSPGVTREREKENCALKPYTNLQLQYQDWDARQGQDRKTEDRKLESGSQVLETGQKIP